MRDPILEDVPHARALTGLSGAQVFLVSKDGRHWFVRKAARDAAQSVRLKGQAEKQARFLGPIKTPRILGEGTADGRYYFDMELVRGPDGASYLRRATFPEVVSFTEQLCRYLAAAAEAPPIGANGARARNGFEALYAKVCEVQKKTGALAPEVLSRVFLGLDRLRQRGDVGLTLCHGDLTLENLVIAEDGAIWVLDLLDAPFEHWWLDVAKLHQDLSGGWYLRNQPPVALGVMQYVSTRLLDAAEHISDRYAELHAALVACTFIRILPYVSSAEERRFVLERIAHFAEECS